MEEPKRRVRRVQQEQGETHAPDASVQETETAQNMTPEETMHRRRRPQQPEQIESGQIASAQIEDAQAAWEQTQKEQQPKQRELKKQKKEKKNQRQYGHALKQGLMGAAVLMSMAGTVIAKAVRKIKREHVRLIAMVLCTCVALFSAWQVGSIILRSVRTNRLNDELSRQRAAMIEAQQTDETETAPQPEVMQEPMDEPVALQEENPEEALEEEWNQEADIPEDDMPAATPRPDIVRMTKYRQVGGDALPEMAPLHQQNHDLVAWIQIPDVLDLPVVYRDNSYYLTRDFNKQKNASGTIFLDKDHPFKEKTQNLLLHGHNMKDGTMFGRLAQYLYDDTYLRNHPFIYFDTLWNKEQYVIVAVLNVSLKPGDARFFNYFTHDTFATDTEFAMYIRQLQLRSRYAIPIDVKPSDALLTLSTCLEDDRLVIVARRLRENETRSELRTLIRMATKQ